MIRLYGSASPNVLKIAIALGELGLPFDWQHVNIWAGEQFSPEVRSLNPLSKVPILVETDDEGETILFESGAILIMLAEKEPGLLMPTSGAARLEVLKWLFVQCANIGPMFGQLTHFSKYAPPSSDYALHRYRGQVERLYAMLESRLAYNTYLAGSRYSIADIATFPWIRLHQVHGQVLGPALGRWFADISARPAVAKAVKRQVEEILPADLAMASAARSEELDRLFPGR